MIKCAAIKRGELVYSIARPARHHDILHAMFRDGAPLFHEVQGFLTEFGDFVDREAAFKLTGKGRNGKTYSEDLW